MPERAHLFKAQCSSTHGGCHPCLSQPCSNVTATLYALSNWDHLCTVPDPYPRVSDVKPFLKLIYVSLHRRSALLPPAKMPFRGFLRLEHPHQILPRQFRSANATTLRTVQLLVRKRLAHLCRPRLGLRSCQGIGFGSALKHTVGVLERGGGRSDCASE